MKYLVIVLLSISLACAHEIRLREGITPQKFPPVSLKQVVASKIDWEKVRNIVEENNQHSVGVGSIEADVTEYTLAILKNVANLIIRLGYDPMQLSDMSLSLFPGSLALSNGWLQDLSTITVTDEVIAKYTRTSKIVELTIPLGFQQILIDYDYHCQVLLLGVTGTVDAKVTDLRIDLHMGFNFTSLEAFVDNVDVKNTGKISVKFTGLGLLDWLVELMSGVFINMLHNLIFGIINAIIYNPVQSIVTAINTAIDSILHPNSTSYMLNPIL